jgi:polyhydroxyalkanoate synthase subunit PhaC
VLVVFAILAVVIVLAVAHVAYWQRRLFVPTDYAHEQVLDTEDGCIIVLRRLPRPDGDIAGPPVLMVHGLCANHRNHDLVPDHSVARHLRACGRDVWLVTLRSGHRMRTWRSRSRVRFDHMVEHDLPLAIREVLRHTAATQVDYVGYSMGGMLMYAAIADPDVRERVRRVVIVGSPPILRVPWPLRGVMHVGARLPRALVPTVHARFFATSFAFASELAFTPMHRLLAGERAALRRGIVPRAMVSAIADIAGPLAADFCSWQSRCGGHVTYRGTPVLAFLPAAEMPALFIAGVLDPLGRVESIRSAFDAWGAPEKQLVVLGREHGARSDYSHGDMVMTEHAREEVFEPIARFLAAQPGSVCGSTAA